MSQLEMEILSNRPIINITGNWHDGGGFRTFIQTREPWPVDGKPLLFHQTLKLPGGTYFIRLEYNLLLDKKPGQSIENAYDNFKGLWVNGKPLVMRFILSKDSKHRFIAEGSFSIDNTSIPVELSLLVFNTRVMRTFLVLPSEYPSDSAFFGLYPEGEGELLTVQGIPFLIRKFASYHNTPYLHYARKIPDSGMIGEWKDGLELDCRGACVKTLYFLGMTHCFDLANGSWYNKKGDHGYSHFVGDQAGEILLKMSDGENHRVPLIFGYNLWYCSSWDMVWHYGRNPYTPETESDNFDAVMFCGEEKYRDILQNAIGLADGVRLMGSNTINTRYVFAVNLEGKSIKSLKIKGNDEIYGFPVISGVTLETREHVDGLAVLPDISEESSAVIPHSLDSIHREEYLEKIEDIKHVLYTFVDELPALWGPEKPEGYFGPEYDFRGSRDAVYAATYLYHNGPECAAYIADTGTGCTSSTAKWALHHYTQGMGVWIERKPLYNGLQEWFRLYMECTPGQLPGYRDAWTRGVGELIREALAFGYDKYVDSYIKWLDTCLLEEASPPHWNRVAGNNHGGGAYKEIQVGDVCERGNRENDGHGICMWGRYIAWHWFGRPTEWNRQHWEATSAAVEWIQWQLDHDMIRPGIRKDVLYTESECAHGSYDFYSSFNCLHGIKLSIRMAEQLDKREEARRWRILYERLAKGILDHLTDESEFGPIWHTEPDCDWQDHAHKLVHLHLATEGDTYAPLEDYQCGSEIDRRYLEIDRNSYRFLMKEKNYNCLRMYGYGQGMMTQAALLMDEMEDAQRFAEMLLTHCYLPKLGKWISPEGIILHKSGKYYLPVNGYMGQDSHVADSTKAVRLMLGIDDNDQAHLRFVPRFPAAWNSMSISGFPVLTGDIRQKVGYEYIRTESNHTFTFRLEQAVDKISLRLGPIPCLKQASAVRFNNTPVPFESIKSGDSQWVWVRNISGNSGKVELSCE